MAYEPIISIIIPIYNTKEYLAECLDSVTGQTYKNLDIILVDDGSVDGSSEICDRYAAGDRRVRVIHQANRGISAARNTGLRSALGEWIGFVDSDDYIDSGMYERMLRCAEKNDADLVACGLNAFSENGGESVIQRQYSISDREMLCEEKEYWADYNHNGSIVFDVLWNKLYRRSLWEGILFPTGQAYEDIYVMHRIVSRASKIYLITDCLCWYRKHPQSITEAISGENQLQYTEALLTRSEYFREKKMVPQEKIVLHAVISNLSHIYFKLEPAHRQKGSIYDSQRRRCLNLCAGVMRHGAGTRLLSESVLFLMGPRAYVKAASLARKIN